MIADTLDKFEVFLRDLNHQLRTDPRVVMDTETSGFDPYGLTDRRPEERSIGSARICGLAVATSAMDSWYLPFRHETDQPQLPAACLGAVVAVLEANHAHYINHNQKFDLQMLAMDNALPNQARIQLEDTMILAYVLNEERESYALEALVAKELGISSTWKRDLETEFKKRKLRRYSEFSVGRLAEYAEEDARNTFLLFDKLYPLLTCPDPPIWGSEKLIEVYRADIDLLWVLMRMEQRGIRIDRDLCRQYSEQLGRDLVKLQADLNNFVGPALQPVKERRMADHEETCPKLNKRTAVECTCSPIYENFLVTSHAQLRKLFEARDWPIPKDKWTARSTFNDIALRRAQIADSTFKEFVKLVLDYRSYLKAKVTYFDSYLSLCDEQGFLHPRYNQHSVITSRLSSSNPNFQNVPKGFSTTRHAVQFETEEMVRYEVRKAIVPRSPDHRFVAFDYSQQEVRMFLHYADEAEMRRIIMTPGLDVHEFAAKKMFGEEAMGEKGSIHYQRMRVYAKVIVFGILYGMGKQKLADSMEISIEKATEFWNNYMATFPQVRVFMREVTKRAGERKHIRYWTGRVRRMRAFTAEEISSGKTKSAIGFVKIRMGDTVDVHKALNSLIQGGCADLTRRAMIRLDRVLAGKRSYLVNQVHDDVLFEIHESEREELIPLIKHALEDWPTFKVPFFVEAKAAPGPGLPWSEAKGSET